MKRTGEGCARPVKSGRLPLPLLIQHRLAAAGLLLALLLGGCTPAASPVESGAQPATAPPTATAAATPTPDPGYEPVFEPGACRFAHRVEWGAQCGDLIVPENRADPGGRTIRLHVAVFKSAREHPAPDPVIHLVGGPGASLLDEAERYLRAGGRHILAERDYILFNQRGSAYGQPELGCGEYEQFLWRIAEERPDQDEAERLAVEAARACRDEYVGQGIDLSAYNSAQSAADVDDLRRALGYEQVNLYGISYGSRLALTVMRDYPEHVRSVILDSVYPPQVDLYSSQAANAERALNVLLGNCAADPACSAAYPDLRQSFLDAVDVLDADPVTLPVFRPDRQYIAQVDGRLFVEMVYNLLYDVATLPTVPRWITVARDRDQLAIAREVNAALGYANHWGAYLSVQCRDEVAFESRAGLEAAAAGVAAPLRSAYATGLMFELCEVWDVGQPPAVENEPVESDIPALLLAGEYDPITPPEWAHLAAETLPNGRVYEFRGVGHGVMRSNECALSIGLQFLEDPTGPLDTSCMAALEGVAFR